MESRPRAGTGLRAVKRATTLNVTLSESAGVTVQSYAPVFASPETMVANGPAGPWRETKTSMLRTPTSSEADHPMVRTAPSIPGGGAVSATTGHEGVRRQRSLNRSSDQTAEAAEGRSVSLRIKSTIATAAVKPRLFEA